MYRGCSLLGACSLGYTDGDYGGRARSLTETTRTRSRRMEYRRVGVCRRVLLSTNFFLRSPQHAVIDSQEYELIPYTKLITITRNCLSGVLPAPESRGRDSVRCVASPLRIRPRWLLPESYSINLVVESERSIFSPLTCVSPLRSQRSQFRRHGQAFHRRFRADSTCPARARPAGSKASPPRTPHSHRIST